MPKTVVKVPKLSGFDKSHSVLLTGHPGTLIPVLCDELPANTPVDLESIMSASLPPLASDTFMRADLKVEAFFCPSRLLYGGYMDWLTRQKQYDPSLGTYKNVGIPHAQVSDSPSAWASTVPGTLADYLGCRVKAVFDPESSRLLDVNLFPFLCYHRIYDDWYRAPLVQKSVFNRPMYDSGFAGVNRLSTLPFISTVEGSNRAFSLEDPTSKFDDGVALGALRQRNFGFDYFTTALPQAQLGDAKGVSFVVSQGSGTISIAAIRAANSLQQFAERNQIAGFRFQDYLKANYNSDLSSGVAQRAILLGSGEIPVYSKGIYQNNSTDAPADARNPFTSVGAEYGSAVCQGKVNLVKNFTAEEPGYLMVLVSLVPRVTYSNGIERMFFRYNVDESQTDLAVPILQNVGNQPIYQAELTGDGAAYDNKSVFGWSDRYSDFKYKPDRLAGLVRDGQSLDAFALQRSVDGSPTISTEFLQIPTNYFDQVTAVADSVSQYGVWIDIFHHYRIAMPLSPFAIPSLQDPAYEHGTDVSVNIGGTRL